MKETPITIKVQGKGFGQGEQFVQVGQLINAALTIFTTEAQTHFRSTCINEQDRV